MVIEYAPIEALRQIAADLHIDLIEREAKQEDTVKVLVRPIIGDMHFRALKVTGHTKQSLCMHGHYAFMSRVLAAFPEARMMTWVNTWDYILFQNAAKSWTDNQIKERAAYDTCDCTPEMIAEAMLSPDERRKVKDNGRGKNNRTSRRRS